MKTLLVLAIIVQFSAVWLALRQGLRVAQRAGWIWLATLTLLLGLRSALALFFLLARGDWSLAAPLAEGVALLASTIILGGILQHSGRLPFRRGRQSLLPESRGHLQSIFEQAGSGMVVLNPQGALLEANGAFGRFLGYAPPELRSLSLEAILHPEDRSRFLPLQTSEAPGSPQATSAELRFLHRDGSTRWGYATMAWQFDVAGRPTCAIGLIQDMTEQKRAQQRLQEKEARLTFISRHDALTQLPNRRTAQENLDHALRQARVTGQQVAVLLIDLDRFKNINDSLGYHVGDQVLLEIAQRLRYWVQASNTVARLGSDEFLVILEGVENIDRAVAVARKFLGILAELIVVEQQELFVTASIGISVFPDHGDDAETLIKRADISRYKAKERGRNNFQIYQPEMDARIRESLILESDLRKALTQDQLELYYQPQFDVVSGRLIGMESLARWQHHRHGLVLPGQFIPLAVESGLMVPIGEWNLRTACLQNKAWQDAGFPLVPVAINISAPQFHHSNLVKSVAQNLADTGLDPRCLELEIVESVVMDDVEFAIETMRQLNALGVTLAIDDFGTGYSSLNYLKRFPIRRLKIDRSFVMDVTTDPNDAAIATSIIGLARNMNLDVIAEGVETQEQLAFLHDHGCRKIQGFLHGRPTPAAEFGRFFAGCPVHPGPVAAASC